MLKQIVYNYVDLDGTKWNTTNNGIENVDNSTVIPTEDLLNLGSEQPIRLSLQARPGTFFNFGGTKLMITNSGIFNYEGQAMKLFFPTTPSWFILDYETEDEV